MTPSFYVKLRELRNQFFQATQPCLKYLAKLRSTFCMHTMILHPDGTSEMLPGNEVTAAEEDAGKYLSLMVSYFQRKIDDLYLNAEPVDLQGMSKDEIDRFVEVRAETQKRREEECGKSS